MFSPDDVIFVKTIFVYFDYILYNIVIRVSLICHSIVVIEIKFIYLFIYADMLI